MTSELRLFALYEVPSELSKAKSGSFTEPPSAVIAPSSVTHRLSPQARHKELTPATHDTGKDTQKLVEEDC
ncbi:hypothetical protein YQE_07807, partial [Dendroctonus ponderosae]